MKRNSEVITMAVLGIVLALAGCSPASDEELLTLADSKSPAQLLRNEAGNRIPAEVVDRIVSASDTSVHCAIDDEDADGLMRAWQSTAEVTLTAEAASTVDTLVDDLVKTFLDQGWTDRSLGGSTIDYNRFLASDTSSAVIRITGKRLGVADDSTSSEGDTGDKGILLEVRGPCVVTDGPDSDEVRSLEGKS